MRHNSVLFVSPDYHSSFALQKEFRKISWKADIYVPAGFPERFLFESEDVIRAKSYLRGRPKWNYLVGAFNFINFIWMSRKYRYQIHYGSLVHPHFVELPRFLKHVLGEEFHLGLWLLRLMGRKILYTPSGCRDEELRSEFELFDDGAVCRNCGYSDKCEDSNIYPNLKRANTYAQLSFGNGFLEPSYLDVKHTRQKSIDLEVWKPISISSNKKIRVLHSHALENRNTRQLNIKGSPVIVETMRKIEAVLSNVEFIEVTGLTTREMRKEQQKADIIIDQLRYGHWGSTGIEAMALGKVLVCYVRPSWKDNFLRNFPEYSDFPIVHANVENLFEVMYNLLTNIEIIDDLKVRSRRFAEAHYDPSRNVHDLTKVLLAL